MAVFATLGCDGQEARPPTYDSIALGGSRNISTSSSNAGVKGEYPKGPYSAGNPEIGDIVEDLNFYGYVPKGRGTRAADGELKHLMMSDLRATGAPYLLVHVSSIWCATCFVGAERLEKTVREIDAAGGAVLEFVVDGNATGSPPSTREVEVWAESTDLTIPTVGPGDDRVVKVFPHRDFVYIIDLETMAVVYRIEGLNSDPMPIEIAAKELLNHWLRD